MMGNIANIVDLLIELKLFDTVTNAKLKKYYKLVPTPFFKKVLQILTMECFLPIMKHLLQIKRTFLRIIYIFKYEIYDKYKAAVYSLLMFFSWVKRILQ